jgi:hypothetical protein
VLDDEQAEALAAGRAGSRFEVEPTSPEQPKRTTQGLSADGGLLQLGRWRR